MEVKSRPTETKAFIEMEKELKDQKIEQNDTTMMIEITGTIALRTIPGNGNRKLQVNALLDDASTKTYINADVAAELGLQGCLRKVNVSLLNGKVETFETSPIECVIESLDGKSCSKITAFMANRVTGNMKVTLEYLCQDVATFERVVILQIRVNINCGCVNRLRLF